jgi:MFS family permease
MAVAYARTALSPLQESMRVDLALGDTHMALLQGPALALPVALAAIPLGLLIDRHSRVRLLLIFAVIDLAGSLLTALASSFALLFAARCLVGLTVAATSTTAFSLLADLYPPAQRGRAAMVIGVGQYAGFATAFALGGTLLGVAGTTAAWRWAMLYLSLPLALVVCSILAMREPPRSGVVLRNPSTRTAFAELWRYRAQVAPLLAGIVMTEIMILTVLPWAAPALSRHFALSPQRIGAIMALVLVVGGVLGPVAGGFLADLSQRGAGPHRTMLTLSGLAFLCIPAGLFAVAPGIITASILLLIFMTLGNAILTAGTALFTIVVPNEIRGLCLALSGAAAVLLGLGLAPVAVSALSAALGGPDMIGKALGSICVTASVLLAATYLLGTRYVPRSAPA